MVNHRTEAAPDGLDVGASSGGRCEPNSHLMKEDSMTTIAVGAAGRVTDRHLAADLDRIAAALDDQRHALVVVAGTETVAGGWPVSATVHVLGAEDALAEAVRELQQAARVFREQGVQ